MARHKDNVYKSINFLYTGNEPLELGIQSTIVKKIEIFRSDLIKYVQDLYVEIYKTLMKDIKLDLSKWMDF